MSCNGCVHYGYGLCTSLLEIDSIERIEKLLELAPKYRETVHSILEQRGISDPEVADYLDTNKEDEDHGYATLLRNALEEITGVSFFDCEDTNGNSHLLYIPQYPWLMSENDKKVSRELLDLVYTTYISIVSDTQFEIGYLDVTEC